MTNKSKQNKKPSRQIADNRKARFDFKIEQAFEAGLVLEGWEVKSLREGHAQLKESYVIIKHGEAWLIGLHITPFKNVSTHKVCDPVRTRKLLLSRKELNKLQASVSREGYTVVPLNLHFTRGRIKLDVALAKGKKEHDKRASIKDRDWNRQKAQILNPKRQ
jgi:SsrA-binding protein